MAMAETRTAPMAGSSSGSRCPTEAHAARRPNERPFAFGDWRPRCSIAAGGTRTVRRECRSTSQR